MFQNHTDFLSRSDMTSLIISQAVSSIMDGKAQGHPLEVPVKHKRAPLHPLEVPRQAQKSPLQKNVIFFMFYVIIIL